MKTKVYLAGGMHNNWRNKVSVIKDMIFYDPKLRDKNRKSRLSPDEYTAWDLHFIKQCDILFAYMEKDNPSGFGMCAEIGYAKALNKTIIFVYDTKVDEPRSKYFEFIKQMCDVHFYTIKMAIEYLKDY